jgi:hypothetical protein
MKSGARDDPAREEVGESNMATTFAGTLVPGGPVA